MGNGQNAGQYLRERIEQMNANETLTVDAHLKSGSWVNGAARIVTGTAANIVKIGSTFVDLVEIDSWSVWD